MLFWCHYSPVPVGDSPKSWARNQLKLVEYLYSPPPHRREFHCEPVVLTPSKNDYFLPGQQSLIWWLVLWRQNASPKGNFPHYSLLPALSRAPCIPGTLPGLLVHFSTCGSGHDFMWSDCSAMVSHTNELILINLDIYTLLFSSVTQSSLQYVYPHSNNPLKNAWSVQDHPSQH